jgi:hypothetical protein
MLRQACNQVRVWDNLFKGHSRLTLSMNFSASQIAQGDFVERLRHIRRETGLDASRLRLEITENVTMQDVDIAAAMLSRLRELDVQVHIDDFGTGHSSLSALHYFPIDALKIDRLFVEMSAADKDTTSVSLRASWRSSTSWSSSSLDYSRHGNIRRVRKSPIVYGKRPALQCPLGLRGAGGALRADSLRLGGSFTRPYVYSAAQYLVVNDQASRFDT